MKACLWGSCYVLLSAAAVLSANATSGKETAKTKTQPAASANADLDAIRQESDKFVAAFNRRDAKDVAALWTEDGEYVDDAGQKLSGRDAIAQYYAKFFQANPQAKIQLHIDSLRLIGENAAIEDGRATLDAPLGPPGYGKYVAVHAKVNGKWYMASVRDSRVDVPSAYQHLTDWEWLVGTWTAEEHGHKSTSTFQWIANKSYLERRYSVEHADGTTTTGVQIIGFNPQLSRVQSWNFSGDGGHAVGVWSPHNNGWQAEVLGATGDNQPTSAVNVLTRLDDNTFAWQSRNRSVAGQPLPDTNEVIFKRQNSR